MTRSQLFSRVKKLQLLSTKLVESLLSGNYRSVFRGPGIEFAEVREYVEGDDARLIDWNVSSRLGSTYTKTFREERELTLFLIVDMSSSLVSGWGDTLRRETQRLLFSLLSFAAVQNNDRVGAVFFTDRIENWVRPTKGKKHVLRLIQDMLSFQPQGRGSDLGMALRTVVESMKRRGICVILSDFKTTGYSRPLTLLARKHDVIAVRITDPLDVEYPESGLVHMADPETGETLVAPGTSKGFRRRYESFWENQRRMWRRECIRVGASPLEISTWDDPVAKLLQFFRRRKKR
jgi:uncharacterized protein (DUF58 family)